MNEYIERGAVCNDCDNQRICVDKTKCPVGRTSAADVVEVKHGEWEKVSWWQHQNRYECNECSLCGCRVKPKFTYNFCPNCGADMRGGNNGEE